MLTWTWSFQSSKLLVRKIHSQPNNVTHALDVLNQIDAASSSKDRHNIAVAAIRVCGNVNNPTLGLELYNKYPSEATRATTISMLGSCHQLSRAVQLLENSTSAASFNAAIAACIRDKKWELALNIYQNMPQSMVSTVTTNALLTVLAKCRQGKEALDILGGIQPTSNPKPGSDSVTYTLVTSALVRSDMLQEATELLENLTTTKQDHYCSPKSIEAMYDVVISAYSHTSNWTGVARLEQLRNSEIELDSNVIPSDYRFDEWKGFERMGKGKESYWVIGNYVNPDAMMNITVGCRPHRNPSKNGIQILFYENFICDTKWKQDKIGFLLMQNNFRAKASSLLGMFLNPTERGRGMSKVCLSIWIWLSLKGSISPVTGIIRKPLLALILQHTFEYVDSNSSSETTHGGVPSGNLVELSQDPEDPKFVVLYSISGKSLEGALSFADRKHQNIKIASQQPSTRGRLVRIGAKLYPPSNPHELQAICDDTLSTSSNFWKCDLSCDEIQRIFFGKVLE